MVEHVYDEPILPVIPHEASRQVNAYMLDRYETGSHDLLMYEILAMHRIVAESR